MTRGRRYENYSRHCYGGGTENSVILGDCLEFMKLMPDNSFSCVLTSPPYNFGNKGMNGDGAKYEEYQDNLSQDEYFNWQKKVIEESMRVSDVVFYNIQMLSNNKQALFRLIGNFYDKIKEVMVWDKITAEPAIADGVLNSQFEFVFVFSNKTNNRRFYTFNAGRGTLTNVLKVPKNVNNITDSHSAIFPLDLPTFFIKNFTNENDIVYDPFLGSGSTALAAKQLKRRFVGTDISESYCEIAEQRIKGAMMSML